MSSEPWQAKNKKKTSKVRENVFAIFCMNDAALANFSPESYPTLQNLYAICVESLQ